MAALPVVRGARVPRRVLEAAPVGHVMGCGFYSGAPDLVRGAWSGAARADVPGVGGRAASSGLLLPWPVWPWGRVRGGAPVGWAGFP